MFNVHPVWQGKYPLIKASLTLNKQSLGPSLVARPIFDYLNLLNGCTLRAILLQRFDLIVNSAQKCSVKVLKRWMLLDLTGCYLVPFALPLRVIQPQGFHLTCLHKNHCHGSDRKNLFEFYEYSCSKPILSQATPHTPEGPRLRTSSGRSVPASVSKVCQWSLGLGCIFEGQSWLFLIS